MILFVEIGLWIIATIILALDFFGVAPLSQVVVMCMSSLLFFYFACWNAVFYQVPLSQTQKINFLSKEGSRKLPVFLTTLMIVITLLGVLFRYMLWVERIPFLPIGLIGIGCSMIFHLAFTRRNNPELFKRLITRILGVGAIGLLLFLTPIKILIESKIR